MRIPDETKTLYILSHGYFVEKGAKQDLLLTKSLTSTESYYHHTEPQHLETIPSYADINIYLCSPFGSLATCHSIYDRDLKDIFSTHGIEIFHNKALQRQRPNFVFYDTASLYRAGDQYPNLNICFERDSNLWNIFEINPSLKHNIKKFNMNTIGMPSVSKLFQPGSNVSSPFTLHEFITHILFTEKHNSTSSTRYNIIVQACAPEIENPILRRRLNNIYKSGLQRLKGQQYDLGTNTNSLAGTLYTNQIERHNATPFFNYSKTPKMANLVLQAQKQKKKAEEPFSIVKTIKECLGYGCNTKKAQGRKKIEVQKEK